jgi:hypothetical protein
MQQTGRAAREPDALHADAPQEDHEGRAAAVHNRTVRERSDGRGPISLTLYAVIDKADTNWIVILKDVGPDVSVVTARQGERTVPANLPERELTRGWLKASYRAIDPARSKPGEPFHKLTRSSIWTGSQSIPRIC